MMKNPVKLLFSALLVVFAAGCSSCCAGECTKDNAKQCGTDCNCPVLMIVGEETDSDGDCTVCTVWCDAYSPCMNAVAACPAQSRKALKDAPLCNDCKAKIAECAKQRKNCGVCGKDKKACAACKDKLDKEKVCKLMTKDSMKKNMNCKKCAATAKDCAVKKAKAQKADGTDNNSDDAVLVVEADVVTITPVPDNAVPQTPGKAPAAK